MKAPESLETLLDYGIIQEVVRPLMSGKEAQVYLVVAGGEECVAKVYKEASQRTFKHRADYTEGRRTRNSRDQRAMTKRTRHGRQKDEDAWRSTEVDMIYRLRDAGVRVPEPHNFVEGVLVMELVKDADGRAAPRLGDLDFSASEAREIYTKLLREAIRMLCAGVIHGDLSVFNVLMAADGPVVIDFPQSVDPTHNRNGEKLFLRDIENLQRFIARFAPGDPVRPYGEEIWSLFQSNRLEPDTQLTGLYQAPRGKANTDDVMALIADANRDEARRRRGPRLHDGQEDEQEDEDFEAARSALAKSTTPPTSPAREIAPLRKVVDFTVEARSGGRSDPRRKPRARPRGERTQGSVPSPRGRPAEGKSGPPTGPAASRPGRSDERGEGADRARGRRRRGAGRRGSLATGGASGGASGETSRETSGQGSRDAERSDRTTGSASRDARPLGPASMRPDAGSAEPASTTSGRGSRGRGSGAGPDASASPRGPRGNESEADRSPKEREAGERPRRRRRRRRAGAPE